MTKTLLGLTALLTLTGCSATANINATPLKEQSATQVQADRKRCNEWSKATAYVRTGYAACLVAAGYETTPQVGSSSQTMRLAGAATATEPTRVFLDVLECDSQAQQEAERGLGMISTWIRDNLKWRYNVKKRRQLFVDCLKPRGYEIGKS
jgi:TolA-binding protein